MITKSEFKSFIDLTKDTYDDAIDLIIAGVNDFVEGFCNNKLSQSDVVDYFDSSEVDDEGNLYLSNRINITDFALYYNSGTDTAPEWTEIEASGGYITYFDEGIIRLESIRSGYKEYKASYKAGYVLSGEGANVPDDLKLACLKLASAEYNKRRSGGSSSESNEGASVSFSASLSSDIKEILSRYKSYEI